MTKQLYDFKVGDKVWHISEPGRYGAVYSISSTEFPNTIWVQWTSISKIAYTEGVRPKTLSKACQPYSHGTMRHTHRKR